MAIYGGVEDYQILQYYLKDYHNAGELKPGVNIQNPFILEPQNTPSFGIGKGVEGDYIFKDFATGHQGTAANLVMELFGYNYKQAILRIEKDFGTGQGKPKHYDAPEEKEVTFEFTEKSFSESDLSFWAKGNIDPTFNDVLNLASFKRGETGPTIVAKEDDPIYAYKITDDCYKIYRPFTQDKRFKFSWLGKKPKDYVFGYDRLDAEGEIVILCAGEKDTLTLINNGFNAICLNSETASPSSELLFDLNSRFKIFACCYDLDKTGKEQTEKLKKLGLAQITLPDELSTYGKDVFDFFTHKDKLSVTFADLVEETKAYNRYAVFNKPYRMTFDLDVPKGVEVLRFKNASFLEKGDVSTIVASPGIGKSQTSDAVSSLILNPNCDALGFEIGDTIEKILHIDTERNPNGLKKGYYNIFRRANVTLSDSPRLHYWSFKMNDTPQANRELLEQMTKEQKYDLIIMDGIGDFVRNLNDEEECMQFINWLTIFVQRNDSSALCTVHENPGSNGKATGHLGSTILKKASSVLRLQRNKDEKLIRELTTDFEHGKLRNGLPAGMEDVTSYFRWDNSENVNMYVSLSDEDVNMFTADNTVKKTPKYYLEKVFFNTSCNFTKQQVLIQLSEEYALSSDKVTKLIKEWSDLGYIVNYNGVYSLARQENNRIPSEVKSEFELDFKSEVSEEPPF